MSDNEMRAAFEKWAKKDGGLLIEKSRGKYVWGTTCRSWIAWQAAQRPALTDEQVREIADKWSRAWTMDASLRQVCAIESAIREAIGRGERG